MGYLRRRLAYIISLLLGAGLLAAARLPLAVVDGRLLVWTSIVAFTAALVAVAGTHVSYHAGAPVFRSLRLAAPAVFLAASSFLYLLIVETALGRYGLAALVMFLTAVFFENLRRSPEGAERSGPTNLVHLSLVLDALSLFFLLSFIFGVAAFFYVSLPLAAAVIGLVAAAMTREMLWRSGLQSREYVSLIVAAGLIGAETYVALALLPTSHLVNAAVAVVLLSAALHVVRQVLSGAGEFRYFRKELAASLLLAVLLMTTARWA